MEERRVRRSHAREKHTVSEDEQARKHCVRGCMGQHCGDKGRVLGALIVEGF